MGFRKDTVISSDWKMIPAADFILQHQSDEVANFQTKFTTYRIYAFYHKVQGVYPCYDIMIIRDRKSGGKKYIQFEPVQGDQTDNLFLIKKELTAKFIEWLDDRHPRLLEIKCIGKYKHKLLSLWSHMLEDLGYLPFRQNVYWNSTGKDYIIEQLYKRIGVLR